MSEEILKKYRRKLCNYWFVDELSKFWLSEKRSDGICGCKFDKMYYFCPKQFVVTVTVC